jgi:hypothetical protein
MTKILQCKTDVATLLLAVADASGVLRFPADGRFEPFYGLHVAVKPLLPIGPQLVEAASLALGIQSTIAMDLCQDFADELHLPDGQLSTVYTGRLDSSVVTAPTSWLSLPEILKNMPKDRRRLPYLRAWQVLTGALTLDTKALDVEEIGKHLIN